MEWRIIGLNFLYAETLTYVERIHANLARMDENGRVVR